MEITRGVISTAKKTVIYGVEGIGKTMLASHFPDPLYSDTEGSTKDYPLARLPAPSSWAMLLEEARFVRDNKPCKTYIIDTADWAEILCSKHICAKAEKTGIEDFGYGKGYVYLKEEFAKLLDILEEIVQRGIHVVLTSHATIRKIELPDEMGAYDKYELKTSKHVAPLMKEWADVVLFLNFKTYVTITDEKSGKGKAQGNRRVMYATHNACWDAKNRFGLPDMMDLDYNNIRFLYEGQAPTSQQTIKTTKAEPALPPQTNNTASTQSTVSAKEFAEQQVEQLQQKGFSIDQIVDDESEQQALAQNDFAADVQIPPLPSDSDDPVVQRLYQLMNAKGMSTDVLQATVADAGYFPRSTPIENYPKDFIEGCLIGAWDSVCAKAQQYMQTAFN